MKLYFIFDKLLESYISFFVMKNDKAAALSVRRSLEDAEKKDALFDKFNYSLFSIGNIPDNPLDFGKFVSNLSEVRIFSEEVEK